MNEISWSLLGLGSAAVIIDLFHIIYQMMKIGAPLVGAYGW
jgi:hypothetical protein